MLLSLSRELAEPGSLQLEKFIALGESWLALAVVAADCGVVWNLDLSLTPPSSTTAGVPGQRGITFY